MATTTTEQIVREAPEVEALRLGLLTSAKGLAENPLQLPAYNVAGQSPLTTQASQLAAQGVGSYLPYLSAAQGALTGSAGTYNEARNVLGGGLGALQAFPGAYGYLSASEQAAGTAVPGAQALSLASLGQYNPQTNVQNFYNPYTEGVIQQQYADIARLGNIQRNEAAARAARAGAFGGSRSAIEQSEIGRNVLEQQARTGAQLRATGYQSAQEAAQKAYETAQARTGQAAQTFGQLGLSQADLLRQLGTSGGALAGQQAEISRALGLGIGSLGTELGKLGVQQAALGELQSKLGLQDIQSLAAMGTTEQQQQQKILDAARATTLQQLYEPYQRAGFLSDIYKGTPTSQQTIAASTAPNPSLGSQLVGTGIAALGGAAALNKSGLLG